MNNYNIPSMNFFTKDRMLEFWGYVRELLLATSPMVMLGVAIIAVGLLLGIIISMFKQANREDNDNDHDDDYEVRHY